MRALPDILYNFRWIREGEAARSSQAYFGGLTRLMRRHGLKAVVNLRGENSDLSWWRYERAVCERLGARHFDAMLDSGKLPLRPMLVRLVDVFDEAPRPFLLKCSGGQDRTGFAAALYLIHRDGWGAEGAAREQFASFTSPKTYQRWLKAFVAFAKEEAKGRALADWIRSDYDPGRLVEWLGRHGLADGYKRIFDKPERSPWQL